MTNIERTDRIDKLKLNDEQYFQSVIEQAYIVGLFSDKEIEKIQFDCFAFLAKLTERYNNGNSSSIRIETAQNILTSVMFTIGLCLKTYSSADEAAQALRDEKLEVLYQKGQKQIERKIHISKLIHSRITSNLFETPNVFYHASIVDSINGFFKLYRPDYFAHEINITADYSTCKPVNCTMGIEFIREYLEYLYYENDFCNHFQADNVHHLLCGYEDEYQNLLINIFEPVYISALGCILIHSDVYTLKLSCSDVKHLSRRLSGCSDIEFRHLLDSALEELITTLAISPKTAAYLNVCLEKVSIIIKNAISRNVPEKAFLILKYPEDTPEFKCSFSGKMDDELYRKVLQEVVACQTTEEKNQIIKKYIHSLADLEDIMLDAELSKTEMISVFQELTTGELAALAKKYDIYTKCSLSDMHSSEMRLYNCLNSYIAMLAPEQQSCVKEAAKIIRVIE